MKVRIACVVNPQVRHSEGIDYIERSTLISMSDREDKKKKEAEEQEERFRKALKDEERRRREHEDEDEEKNIY
jgi:hypothetical protein